MRRFIAWTVYIASLGGIAAGIVWMIQHGHDIAAVFTLILGLLFMFICAPDSEPRHLPERS